MDHAEEQPLRSSLALIVFVCGQKVQGDHIVITGAGGEVHRIWLNQQLGRPHLAFVDLVDW